MNTIIPGKPAENLPGPILLDGFFQSFLLGTIVNQAFKYILDYRDDSWKKRTFVISVITLCFLQTMLEDYKVWRTLILHRRWSTSLIEWSDLFLNGTICWLCEGFYIRRCWKMMGKRIWMLLPLSVLSILIMAANLYLAVAMGIAFRTLEGTDDTLTESHFLLPSVCSNNTTPWRLTITPNSVLEDNFCFFFLDFRVFGYFTPTIRSSNTPELIHLSVLETLVTVLLSISLWRSKTGLREVDKTIIKVIHITWESAILPSICMVIAVGLYHAKPRVDDHLVLFFVLLTGKFYTFGMLRTLNSRQKLRREIRAHERGLGRTSLSTWQWDRATLHMASDRQPKTSTSSTSTAMLSSSTPAPSHMASESVEERQCCLQDVEGNDDLPLASSVQVNTPSMDAQETGSVRHRISSGPSVIV
ncbi:hypothetical protein CVT26_000533 [Gymnopilus dilepis]|uniref:DUF6534 domain-containing protein n=1 Tax=Gymnopilus dilepis TaxID=231916 RepID=A0A409VH40_9AGAR|nr:hypothetical protein CVT26_000533 [Gymnopilus dilepis]